MSGINVNVAEVKARFEASTTATYTWSTLDSHVQCKKEHDSKIYWEEYEKRVAANKAAWPSDYW